MGYPLLRIGTRGSPMALAQTHRVRRALSIANPDLQEADAIEIVVIQTTADRVQDRRLAEIGGKGLFTKEIEEALIAGSIDMAVHSMKDVPTWLPEGLEIACVLERDDPRDALISTRAQSFAELPSGAVVGTASLRRQAQILHRWPGLRVVPFRGNANTRLRKLADGVVDATLLALSGLERIGRTDAIAMVLAVEEMLPAVAQGALGVETRRADERAQAWLEPLNHHPTNVCISAERSLLAALDGSCRTPIAGLAMLPTSDALHLQGLIANPDGSAIHEGRRCGLPSDAIAMGKDLGQELRKRAGQGLFEGEVGYPRMNE